MEFGLTETQELYRQQVGDFVDDQIIGENLDWDDDQNFPWGVYEELADMGLIQMEIPEDGGGQGIDRQTVGLIYEQLGRGDAGLSMLLMVQNSVNYVLYTQGDEREQDIARANGRGENILGWCLTEPEHGSDAGAIETTAERTDNGWLVNGRKTAITGATFADYGILFARRASDQGLRPFLLPFDADGLEVQKYEGMGCDLSGWGQLFLDDVRLDEDALVADRNAFKTAMEVFDPSRGYIPLFCLGAAQQTLDETEEYMTEREAFGRELAEFQGPQFQIAEMRTRVEVARLKALETLWRDDNGLDYTKDAAMAKWFGTEVATETIRDCIVLHGNYGYSKAFGLEKRLRDVLGLEIGEGPQQIQKTIIARETWGRDYLPY
jgi:cyclohexanecarboxyl-CoA dehydrogenase